ncbi:UDP-galactopyranose mutase [Pectinatus frisingensis]|uniref:UDP-galactopyranose mutase n=1 Tax=Pectinatus frisingensis TaxID=865 RepID=UPI0018C7E208|nr:UDP-galactopyranose mutase [Pectinatus frisingensis]
MKYDYLIVGSGLFGSVFAHEAMKCGKRCLIIDKRSHVGGNVYCENKDGINIHMYGAHIFHTNNRKIWDYIKTFADFNQYVNSPLANYRGELYNLPFNMNTFHQMWGCRTPSEARTIIDGQKRQYGSCVPQNLEEQAISLVGEDIYKKLIKGYTEKQWHKDCTELPAFIIRRLPVRYRYDNNYFNDRYQGIPIGGYNKIIGRLTLGADIEINADFNKNRDFYRNTAIKIVYTGPVDEYFDYTLGELEYRGLRFETQYMEMENYQGVAVMNFTDRKIPYTRVIEHKHFEFGTQPVTYVTYEYPCNYKRGQDAYYPINDGKNQKLYNEYKMLTIKEDNVLFGGRLAEYKYYNMDQVINSALKISENELGRIDGE